MTEHLPTIELPFFTNLLILLVISKVFGEIFERFRQPAMIGEILAGVLLGPSLLNLIHRTEEIKTISELGIFFLVVIAGLEINFDDILKSLKGRNLVISLLAFFVPNFAGFAVGYFFGLQAMTSVFIGLCVAITALPVSIRILMDLGKINHSIGQKIISVAIFDDILALTILGVLLNIKDTDMSLLSVTKYAAISIGKLCLFLGFLTGVYYLIQKIAKRENYIERELNRVILFLKSKESLYAILFAFILIFSTVTESLGLHFVIGAFFAAMLLNQKILGHKNFESFEKTVTSLAMGFLAPIFFAGIGLEFNISSISNLPLLAAVIAVSYLSKIVGGYVGGRIARMDNLSSLTMALGLNARGIMELVIANIAYKAGLISTEIFSILVIMGLLTTLTTPFFLKKAFDRLSITK